jgi:hypothetical protein
MEKDKVKIGTDVDYNFAKLMEHRKDDLSMRVKSNWSYDILRSPDFMQAHKIKKRIVAWEKKLVDAKEKQATLKPQRKKH